jgi:heme oxygenase
MSLKELTKDKHDAAENTKFMQHVFNQKLPTRLWNDYTLQRAIIYSAIETKCVNFGLISSTSELIRAPKLMQDFLSSNQEFYVRPVTVKYQDYIRHLKSPQHILAHLYTWHMGDLFGGQYIAKVVPGSGKFYQFENPEELKVAIRAELTDDYGDEARVAFEWAIKIMRELGNE